MKDIDSRQPLLAPLNQRMGHLKLDVSQYTSFSPLTHSLRILCD